MTPLAALLLSIPTVSKLRNSTNFVRKREVELGQKGEENGGFGGLEVMNLELPSSASLLPLHPRFPFSLGLHGLAS